MSLSYDILFDHEDNYLYTITQSEQLAGPLN